MRGMPNRYEPEVFRDEPSGYMHEIEVVMKQLHSLASPDNGVLSAVQSGELVHCSYHVGDRLPWSVLV